MAACGRLQHIFENPLPESSKLLESLSPWKAIKNMKPVENSTFTEIFGELHFKENQHESSSSSSSPSSSSSSSSSSFLLPESSPSSSSCGGIEKAFDNIGESLKNSGGERSRSPASSFHPTSHKKHYKHTDSFSSMNLESLSLCTEGLGFESSDDVEDLGNETSFDFQIPEAKTCYARHSGPESISRESKRSRTKRWSFPPPISCIGRTGKPWVCFKSYRQDGRFILQEIRFPAQEFLHACREDGRLRLQLIQSDDEILEGDEDEYSDDDASEDTQDVNEETEGNDADDNHENHQELNSDTQDEDVEEGVHITNYDDVQDSSD